MAIGDLFSVSFLFSISTIAFVCAIIASIFGIFTYISNRMSEQDHKLKTMMELISIMSVNQSNIKHELDKIANSENNNDNNISLKISDDTNKTILINVSDNEDDILEESESESAFDVDEESDLETESDLDSESDSESMNELEEPYDSDSEDDESDIKLTSHQFDLSMIDVHELHETQLELEADSNENDAELSISELKTVDEKPEECGKNEENNEEKNEMESSDSKIKTIHLNIDMDDAFLLESMHSNVTSLPGAISETNATSEHDETKSHKPDYKKMSVKKLKEVVVEKGLTTDSSKMTKQELIAMLE